MMKTLKVICVVLLVVGLGFIVVKLCDDGTVKVNLTQAMIDDALAKKFPKTTTYLKIVKVRYSNPKAKLLAEQGKVLVSLDVQVTVGIKGLETSYHGSAALSTRVGYHATDYRFYLQDAELQALEIPKIAQDKLEFVREGLNVIAREFVDEVPIYRLSENDTKTHLAKLFLKAIDIRPDRVVVTLGL